MIIGAIFSMMTVLGTHWDYTGRLLQRYQSGSNKFNFYPSTINLHDMFMANTKNVSSTQMFDLKFVMSVPKPLYYLRHNFSIFIGGKYMPAQIDVNVYPIFEYGVHHTYYNTTISMTKLQLQSAFLNGFAITGFQKKFSIAYYAGIDAIYCVNEIRKDTSESLIKTVSVNQIYNNIISDIFKYDTYFKENYCTKMYSLASGCVYKEEAKTCAAENRKLTECRNSRKTTEDMCKAVDISLRRMSEKNMNLSQLNDKFKRDCTDIKQLNDNVCRKRLSQCTIDLQQNSTLLKWMTRNHFGCRAAYDICSGKLQNMTKENAQLKNNITKCGTSLGVCYKANTMLNKLGVLSECHDINENYRNMVSQCSVDKDIAVDYKNLMTAWQSRYLKAVNSFGCFARELYFDNHFNVNPNSSYVDKVIAANNKLIADQKTEIMHYNKTLAIAKNALITKSIHLKKCEFDRDQLNSTLDLITRERNQYRSPLARSVNVQMNQKTALKFFNASVTKYTGERDDCIAKLKLCENNATKIDVERKRCESQLKVIKTGMINLKRDYNMSQSTVRSLRVMINRNAQTIRDQANEIILCRVTKLKLEARITEITRRHNETIANYKKIIAGMELKMNSGS